MRATKNAAVPSQEELLVDFALRLNRHRNDRRAVYLRLSDLGPHIRDTYIIRQAASYFHHLIKAEAGQLFRMASGDLVFASKGAARIEIESAVYKLLQELAHDPVAQARHGDLDDMVEWFDIESNYDDFLALARRLAEGQPPPAATPPAADPVPAPATAPAAAGAAPVVLRPRPRPRDYPQITTPTRPFTAADLDRLESALRMLDVDGMMEDQIVAAIAGSGPPMPVFIEQRFSYDALAASVLPHCDLRADALLFERLAQMIEARILRTVRFHEQRGTLAISLPCHVDAVLSDIFHDFDRERRRHCRCPVIIELRLADLARSVRRFLDARTSLKAAGYRVCITDLDMFDFCLLDQRVLGADFVKIDWRADRVAHFDDDWRRHFQAQATAAGRGRLILAGCTDAAAVAQGRALGFSLFQGTHVDTLITARAAASLAG